MAREKVPRRGFLTTCAAVLLAPLGLGGEDGPVLASAAPIGGHDTSEEALLYGCGCDECARTRRELDEREPIRVEPEPGDGWLEDSPIDWGTLVMEQRKAPF